MPTAPVALPYLDDEDGLVQAARAISELTHHDPEAGDACVLWTTGIRHAVLTGEIDVRIGLHHIDIERRELWAARLAQAEASSPSAFTDNTGWVVAALQGAWSAIVNTLEPAEDSMASSASCFAFDLRSAGSDHVRASLPSPTHCRRALWAAA